MPRTTHALATFLLAAFVAAPTFAGAGDIEIDNAWSRAAMAGHTGALYLTIKDKGPADRLIGASSPVAEKAELHESYSDNGVMKMRAVTALPVSAGNPVTLSPGGYHIMLMNLKQPLRAGESIPASLTFEKAGTVPFHATVAKAGAASAPSGAGQTDDSTKTSH